MTWTNSLKDASLKSATNESITDGVFTYSEYSAIIDTGGMTAVGLTLLAADHSINETNIDLVGLSQTGLDYLLV